MSEVGDAPALVDTGPGSAAAGDTAALPSWQQAMADAIAETGAEDVPEGQEADAEPTEVEAKADDKPTEEKPPEKKPEDKPKEEEPSKLFAAISRERGKVREREAKVAAREKEIEGALTQAKAFVDVRRRIHEDPVGLLREAGGDELINKVLDVLGGETQSPAEQRVAKLERELKERDAKSQAEAQRQQVANWKRDIAEKVTAAGEKYDLVNALGEHEAVSEIIAGYHAKYGHLMSVEDAAELMEKRLEANLGRSKKFGAREAVKPAQASTGTPPPKKPKSNTTLSSVAVGEVPPADDDGPMDPRQRERWAMGIATG